MKKLSLLLLSVFICILSTYAQIDTGYHYYDSGWDICPKEAAIYYGKSFKEDKLWHEFAFSKTGILQREGYFADPQLTVMQDTVKSYYENGHLKYAEYFECGKRMYVHAWYKNGKEMGIIQFYNNGAPPDIKGLNEDGSPKPDNECYSPAQFLDGNQAWLTFLQKKLTEAVEKLRKKKYFTGKVVVSFMINSNGKVSSTSIEETSYNYDFNQSAMDIIQSSLTWIPAKMFGEPVASVRAQKLNVE